MMRFNAGLSFLILYLLQSSALASPASQSFTGRVLRFSQDSIAVTNGKEILEFRADKKLLHLNPPIEIDQEVTVRYFLQAEDIKVVPAQKPGTVPNHLDREDHHLKLDDRGFYNARTRLSSVIEIV